MCHNATVWLLSRYCKKARKLPVLDTWELPIGCSRFKCPDCTDLFVLAARTDFISSSLAMFAVHVENFGSQEEDLRLCMCYSHVNFHAKYRSQKQTLGMSGETVFLKLLKVSAEYIILCYLRKKFNASGTVSLLYYYVIIQKLQATDFNDTRLPVYTNCWPLTAWMDLGYETPPDSNGRCHRRSISPTWEEELVVCTV